VRARARAEASLTPETADKRLEREYDLPGAVRLLQRAATERSVARALASGRDGTGESPPALVAAAAQRRIARIPAYNPSPSWSKKAPSQGPRACNPAPEFEAKAKWWFWHDTFRDEAVDRCKCSEVGPVWDAYFSATGSPKFIWKESEKPTSCIITSLKGDPDHVPHEDAIVAAVRAAMPGLMSRLKEQSAVDIPLASAGVSPALLTPRLVLNNNTRVGGQLFGGLSSPDPVTGVRPDDSEYGPDTRRVDGTVHLTKVPIPGDQDRVMVQARFEFDWHITDAVDFCPGNTGEKAHWKVREALTAISVIEASGMARDIYVEAHYRRPRDEGPWGPFPNPDPKLVPVPGLSLFGFNSHTLSHQAKDALRKALGDRPTRADTSKPVHVRGHTDAVGDHDYNQGLSERRAEAVKEFLEEEYPNLAGHVDAKGFGENQPVAPNTLADGRDNPAGRQANRRVDIELTEKVAR
jgi:outer membrane protein OmpA-like peptidoglycan-associated protein